MVRARTGVTIAVRTPEETIVTRRLSLPSWSLSHWRQYLLIRGVLIMGETLVAGMKALNLSARLAAGEDEAAKNSKTDQAMSGVVLIVALAIGVGLFLLLPLYLSDLVAESIGGIAANFVEGGIRLVVFLGYIWGIGQIKEVRRLYGYHGAEHMTIAAIEAGEELQVNAIRKYPKAHPRCGTSFLLTVIVVSIIVFSFIPRELPLWLLIVSRLVLIPLVIAVSYEILRLVGTRSEHRWAQVVFAPNLLLQRLTTNVPDDSMIEVAITAMQEALRMDGELEASGGSKAAEEHVNDTAQ